jgi:hypothetical protein
MTGVNDELAAELLEEIRALRRAIRELQHGDLVARLTEAERQAIANHVLDRLDERLHAERAPATDTPPRRAKRRGRRGYFDG